MATEIPNRSESLELPTWLGARLSERLPGRSGQRRFSPALGYGRHYGPGAHDARQASVMVLLYPHRGTWHLPLIVRTPSLTAHGGQISFPGGAVESCESPVECAIREYEEELGVKGSGIRTLGMLSPLYVFVSNYLVTPCLATLPSRPAFRPNPREVAQLLEVPVNEIANPVVRETVPISRDGITFQAPCLKLQHHCVWGATAMILGEFMTLLEEWRGLG